MGGTEQEVADILGNSHDIVRKHYAKSSQGRQKRIDALMKDAAVATVIPFGGMNQTARLRIEGRLAVALRRAGSESAQRRRLLFPNHGNPRRARPRVYQPGLR